VQRNEFERKTLHLFKLARAAIIYLSLGMHREEKRRGESDPRKIAPMPLDRWDDRSKRRW
jgi:LA2681-like HEPN